VGAGGEGRSAARASACDDFGNVKTKGLPYELGLARRPALQAGFARSTTPAASMTAIPVPAAEGVDRRPRDGGVALHPAIIGGCPAAFPPQCSNRRSRADLRRRGWGRDDGGPLLATDCVFCDKALRRRTRRMEEGARHRDEPAPPTGPPEPEAYDRREETTVKLASLLIRVPPRLLR
jgi:hypothetical protein